MALSSTGVLEVRPGGSDSNAGYFNPSGGSPGTDYSQQDAAQVTIDGATVTAAVHTTTTQINITGSTASAAWNRNGLRITGGTATAGLYEITAVDVPNNRITVDRSAGTSGQTVTGAMGGGLATPGQAMSTFVSGNCIYLKHGTYTLTTATYNTSGGPISFNHGENSNRLIGYDTTRTEYNSDANRPTIVVPASGVDNINIVTCAAYTAATIRNIIVNGSSKTNVGGFVHGYASAMTSRCAAYNCTYYGFSGSTFYECYAEGCTVRAAYYSGYCYGCVAKDNPSVTGFVGGFTQRCLAIGGAIGFYYAQVPETYANCVAYGNTSHGFYWQVYIRNASLINCVAYGNGGYGFFLEASTGNRQFRLEKFAAGSNSSGATNVGGYFNIEGIIALTADPFTNAAGGDFSLNNTAGGGALLRAAGIPGTVPPFGTTGYLDIGFAQHQDSGGSGVSLWGGF